jgi:hypothetical protein
VRTGRSQTGAVHRVGRARIVLQDPDLTTESQSGVSERRWDAYSWDWPNVGKMARDHWCLEMSPNHRDHCRHYSYTHGKKLRAHVTDPLDASWTPTVTHSLPHKGRLLNWSLDVRALPLLATVWNCPVVEPRWKPHLRAGRMARGANCLKAEVSMLNFEF